MARTHNRHPSTLSLLVTLGAIAVAPACSAPFDSLEDETYIPVEEKLAAEAPQALVASSPELDQVVRKGTHNSYFTARWINEEIGVSGTAEPLLDQLLHEHVRSIELDLQRDHNNPGQFLIRHSYNQPDTSLALIVAAVLGLGVGLAVPSALDSISDANTQCHRLTDCLKILRKFDYALPDHEATVIHLELKEMNILAQARRLFDPTHTVADLDAALWEGLGSRLYTPREMLSRPGCQGKSLVKCVQEEGWPTLEELRGRYIVTVHANWGDNYWDWLDYASGDVTTHVAFPMREFLTYEQSHLEPDVAAKMNGCADYNPWWEINGSSLESNMGRPNIADVACEPWYGAAIKAARANSVFAGSPTDSPPQLDVLLANRVVLRSDSARTTAQPTNEQTHVTNGFGIITNDQPWAFKGDAPATAALPTDPRNAVLARTPFGPDPSLHEPGNRLYFHLSGSPQPAAYAGKNMPFSAPVSDAWEVQPSTTRGPISALLAKSSGEGVLPAPNPAVSGQGCLFASTPDHSSEVRICRDTRDENGEMDDHLRTFVVISVVRPGEPEQTTRLALSHDTYSPYWGDLLRLDVARHQENGGVVSTVFLSTGGEISDYGDPAWEPAKVPLVFPADLSVQGIYGTNDVEMVNLKHNNAPVPASALVTPDPSRLVDLSVAASGKQTWRGSKVERWNTDGAAFVGVHRSTGVRNGQPRHLYTTDVYEARTAGVWIEAEEYFYLARDPGMAGTVPLFKARIGPKVLLQTAPDCGLNPEAARRQCTGPVGYIATSQLPGTTPLYRLHQSGGNYWSSGDYLYTTSTEEVQSAAQYGYKSEGVVGYVWTPGTLDGVPVLPACVGAGAPPAYCSPRYFDASTARQVDEDTLDPQEVRWYAFKVPSKGVVEAYLNIAGPEDVDLALFKDPADISISNSFGHSNVELVRASLPAGTWAYLRVKSYSGNPALFRLNLSEQGAKDSESAYLWPGSYGFPGLYQPARLRVDANEVDWYRVSAWNGIHQITLQFEHAKGDVDVLLFDALGNAVAGSAGVSDTETITVPAALAGPHFLRVYGYQGAVNDYSMIVTAN